MKKANRILWGIVLIAAGVLIALKQVGILSVDLLFDGWWTLFIIVPCGIGLITEHEKLGNFIGLGIGVLLLLSSQKLLDFDMIWKLVVPAIIVLVGGKLVLTGIFGNKGLETRKAIEENGGQIKYGTATFSGTDLHFDGEEFQGAELNAVFGGVKCDLRNAQINQDCVIQVSAIFGGVDIYVPDDLNVKVYSNSVFGGVSDKKHNRPGQAAKTLYINATCIFGGVDIK